MHIKIDTYFYIVTKLDEIKCLIRNKNIEKFLLPSSTHITNIQMMGCLKLNCSRNYFENGIMYLDENMALYVYSRKWSIF